MSNKETMLERVIASLGIAIVNYYDSGEYVKPFKKKEIADCVIQHSAAAGIAALAPGIIPGAGAAISVTIATGAIWTMYIRLSKMINIEFNKDILKVIASAALSNILTNLGGVIAIEVAASFIPGVGIIGAGIAAFALVYIAGILFLQILTRFFNAKANWNDLSKEELEVDIEMDEDMEKE